MRELDRKIEMMKIRKEIEALEDKVKARTRHDQGTEGRKRRLDQEEEESEVTGTPNKKKKPEHDISEKARIPPPRVQQPCPQQREGGSPVVQGVQNPHLHPCGEDEDPAHKNLNPILKINPENQGVQPPPPP